MVRPDEHPEEQHNDANEDDGHSIGVHRVGSVKVDILIDECNFLFRGRSLGRLFGVEIAKFAAKLVNGI